MDGKKLLKRLDQSALLSDKEHILSEHMSEAASSGILIPVEDNQEHEEST